ENSESGAYEQHTLRFTKKLTVMPSDYSSRSMATQIERASGALAMPLQFHSSAHGPAVRNNPSDTCHAGRTYFQATYIQADLYQQSSCCLYDLGLESVSLDSAKESSLE
ncbi:hypothetical protein LCGC14_2332330, partial [marine sediment metagenome]